MTTIYHNPNCSTSRNALALLKEIGETPTIIEYLQSPPSQRELSQLLSQLDMTPRELIRSKESVYNELGLDNDSLSDEELIKAMVANPILINRPIVVTDKGTVLSRPFERIFSILPLDIANFTKENGEVVNNPLL